MVLTAEEEIMVVEKKHKFHIEFEELRHKNEMEELEKKLEIAKEQAKVVGAIRVEK